MRYPSARFLPDGLFDACFWRDANPALEMEENLSSLGGQESLLESRGLTDVDIPADASLKRDGRSDIVGKRASKWDLASEAPVQSKIEIAKIDAEITGHDNRDKESKSIRDAPITVSNSAAGWGSVDDASAWKKDDVNRDWGNTSSGAWKKDNGNRDWDNTTFGRDQSYSTRMSPGLDEWRRGRGNRSPRSGWASSRRNRSRSPPHIFRRDIEDRKERGRKYTQGSVPLCINYTKGHCRRGSECKYLHENRDRDSSWYSRKYSDPAEGNDSRQERGKFAGHRDDGIHSDPLDRHLRSKLPEDDNIGKLDVERERKSTICRDFRSGRCFRESSCRYIHDDDRSSERDGFPTKEPKLERELSGNKEDEEKWRHLQQAKHERERIEGTELPPCHFFNLSSCQKGSSCRYAHQVPSQETSDKRSKDEGLTGKLDDHRPKEESRSAWGAKSESGSQILNWGQNIGPQGVGVSNGETKVLDGSASDKGSNREPYHHPQGKEIKGHLEDYSIWTPKEDVKYQILPKEDSEAPLVTMHQHLNEVSYGRQDIAPVQACVQPSTSTTSFIQQHANTGMFLRSTGGTNPWSSVTVPASNTAICWPGNGINESQTPLSQAPTAATIQVSLAQEESAQKTNAARMDNVNGAPQTNNIMPALLQTDLNIASSQNPASINHTVQLPNISASLAQIFKSVQQIPQLYSSLNSAAAAAAALAPLQPPSYPVTVPSIQPNQVMGSQSRPYDPIADSMEPLTPEETDQHIAMGSAAPYSGKNQLDNQPNEQYSVDEKGLKGVGQPTAAFLANEGAEGKEPCEETQDDGEKEKQTDISMDAHGDVSNDERKSKEAKAMKMFKFALVEAVKEMLKPTWKEGRLSKEAHKTIVKKVVDKVTGSLRGPQLPTTQERIDQYLEFSKSKLTKLVQAYVDKYLKV